jgi:hypothetical protein
MTRLVALAAVLSLTTIACAQVCSSTVAVASCGPTMTVTFAPVGGAGNHTVEVSCQGLDPSGIGLMVWGQTPVTVPFPNCPLLVEFQWGHIINLDATGSYTWSRTWPAWALGYYLIQMGSVQIDSGTGDFTVLSTDLMRAECASS